MFKKKDQLMAVPTGLVVLSDPLSNRSHANSVNETERDLIIEVHNRDRERHDEIRVQCLQWRGVQFVCLHTELLCFVFSFTDCHH